MDRSFLYSFVILWFVFSNLCISAMNHILFSCLCNFPRRFHCQLPAQSLNSSICIFHSAIVRAISVTSKVSIGQWSEQMNDHNRIINCTMVYREAIGYTNVHGKGCRKRFSWILQGSVSEESMGNILQTQDLCTWVILHTYTQTSVILVVR